MTSPVQGSVPKFQPYSVRQLLTRRSRSLLQKARLMVLSLLLMVAHGPAAIAAQTPSFSTTDTGATSNLSVTAELDIGDADVGKNGNVYLVFQFGQTWYVNDGGGWALYSGGVLPIFAVGPLAKRSIGVV